MQTHYDDESLRFFGFQIKYRTIVSEEEHLYSSLPSLSVPKALQAILKAVKAFFNNAKDLQGVIAKYIEEHDSMKKDIEQFQAQRVQALAGELVNKSRTINGVTVITGKFDMMPNAAKDLVFKVRELKSENLVCVVGTVFDGKPMLNVMLSDDMVKDHGLNAGQLVREAAKLMQGGGGGQPHFASAGGKNPDGLSAAIDKVIELCNL